MVVINESVPLVTVVMPAFNASRYIATAIKSVQDQTYPAWELIVVDDGSTDSTAEIVEDLCRLDNRIKLVRQKNGKQGKARNAALALANGSLIAFLDADDLWVNNKLELQVAALQQMNADVVFSNGFSFNEDDVEDETTTFEMPEGRFDGTALFDILILHNRIPILSVLMRRKLIDEVGGFDEREVVQGCEDYDLWLRVAKAEKVFHAMKERLVRYRRHAAASTHLQSNMLKPMLAVVKEHIEHARLPTGTVTRRIRGLYRDLIAALIDEGDLNGASNVMKDLYRWDQSSVITRMQNSLLKLLPRQFNFISRECLYRIEWHINGSLRRIKQT